MSMRSWSEYGYGYRLYNGDNFNRILKFVEGFDESDSTSYEVADFDELEDELGEPVSWAIAKIINIKEGITAFAGYASCGDTDQEEMLGIAPAYSWTFNESDPKTEEQAKNILKKYAAILGITEEPDYFEAEYFG